jgi:hypothetical protein
MGFAWLTFGGPLPHSAEAKHVVYGNPRPLQRAVEWLYHLGQLPVFGVAPIKTAMIVASSSLWITALALSPGGRGFGLALAAGWIVFLVAAGAPLFEWYLAIPALLLIVSACRARVLIGWRVGAGLLVLNATFLYVFAIQDGIAQRRLFQATWMDASRTVGKMTHVKTVFSEAVGALGWYGQAHVLDEVGLVSMDVFRYDRDDDGWYARAVAGLAPDALVVRPRLLYANQPVSGSARPFRCEAEFQELGRHYVEVADFVDTNRYARRNVAHVRILLRRELAATAGVQALPAVAAPGSEPEAPVTSP